MANRRTIDHLRRATSLRTIVPSGPSRRFSASPRRPAAGGAADEYPDAAHSRFLKSTSKAALAVEGIEWQEAEEEEPVDARGDVIAKDVDEVLGREAEKKGRRTKKMNMYQAIRDAMATTMLKDESTVVFGEDVAFGGVFRCTMGLAEEFGPTRVFNTPLTEQGIAGFGIGLAAMGTKAIAEIQFADYIFPAFDQLVNEAAKYRYRSGNNFNVGSLTVRAPCMAVGHGGLYHSQSPEGFFQHAAGLKVVIPRSPLQAKGLLLASIDCPDPIVFLEPKALYRTSTEQVPISSYHLPLDKAEVLTSGADVTVVSYGVPVYTCERAIAMLRDPPPSVAHLVPDSLRGLGVELIDLRTVCPVDAETVARSVRKTGRCVVVHEAAQTGGVGAEVAALVQTECFSRLEAPVKRVCGWDTPFPCALEKFYVPDAVRVLDAIIETASY